MFGRRNKPNSVGLYGKHPTAPDFVRFAASGALLHELDQWISGALVAGERSSEQWASAYDQAPCVGFIVHPHDTAKQSRSLVGAMAPSADRSGRQFPLMLFAEVERAKLGDTYQLLPHHRFITESLALLDRRAELSHEQLAQAARQTGPPAPADLDHSRQRHRDYLDNTDGASAFAAMFRDGMGAQQAGALAALEEIGHSLSGTGQLPRFGVRFPLGDDDPAGDAAFWLELLRHVSHAPLVPHLLWSNHTLLVYFDRLSPKALAALWLPQWQDDSVYDLATSAPPADAEPRAPLPGQPLRALLR